MPYSRASAQGSKRPQAPRLSSPSPLGPAFFTSVLNRRRISYPGTIVAGEVTANPPSRRNPADAAPAALRAIR